MGTPYLGQINVFPFNFAPKGWALCNGQLLSIQQNAALFSLLGTYYGGNGVQTFGLPNLQGRFSLGQSSSFVIGQMGGEVNHTLITTEIPAHNHIMNGSNVTGKLSSPLSNYPGATPSAAYLSTANTTLGNGSSPSGGSQPHANMPPYLVLNFCIALQGIFPSRS
jgi:microcystin-dependent protein